MIFNEIYSVYYKIISRALDLAIKEELTFDSLKSIAQKYGFEESFLGVINALNENRWPLFENDRNEYKTNFSLPIKRPSSLIEKRFIKSILLDRRIRLFLEEDALNEFLNALDDVEPLWNNDDIVYFDRCSNGDDYNSSIYVSNFRSIIGAVHAKSRISVDYCLKNGGHRKYNFIPVKIEYSDKDDKFRVQGKTKKGWITLRLSNIENVECIEKSKKLKDGAFTPPAQIADRTVTVVVKNERNTLERFLFAFSHYYKETSLKGKVKNGVVYYTVILYYNKDDEIELLIRLLSFGPVIEVIGPDCFVSLLKERLKKQANYTLTCS